jgi:hypothetical protein
MAFWSWLDIPLAVLVLAAARGIPLWLDRKKAVAASALVPTAAPETCPTSVGLAEPDERLAQPDERLAQPDERLAQPDERLAQPDERLAQPDERLAQPMCLASALDPQDLLCRSWRRARSAGCPPRSGKGFVCRVPTVPLSTSH